MIIYAYYNEGTPSGMAAFTSARKARAHRAKNYPRNLRPELFRIDIGDLDKGKACALLNQKDFAIEITDIK